MFILEILKAVLFGIVEGITEWLPVSSTGHIILLKNVLNPQMSSEFWDMFKVVIQLGAILAVILLFFHKLNPFSPKKTAIEKSNTWSLWIKVVIAVLPAAIIGLPLDEWMDSTLTETMEAVVIGITLVLYGIAFFIVERIKKNALFKISDVLDIDYRTAILIGCFQCLSIIPGTSRSGSTILGALLLGVSRAAGAEFSFFLAIPTMLGASLLKLVAFLFKASAAPTIIEVISLLIGCVVSFGISLLVIKGLMDFVRRHSFFSFGVYRVIFGIIVMAYFIPKLFA